MENKKQLKEPDINDPKYKYFHKKLGKMMLDNERYFRDVKKYREQLNTHTNGK